MIPNINFEIRYIADFSGDGTIELFDNPDGLGQPIATAVTGSPSNDQMLDFDVSGIGNMIESTNNSWFNDDPPPPPSRLVFEYAAGRSGQPGSSKD